jgi:cytoskeletal protein RodZ
MSRLGEILRAQREKKGITLDQAAADTRIREKFLTALEDGDVQSLPGAVYTKGFLRNYAAYLDLNDEELILLYHQERGLVAEPKQTKRAYKTMQPIGKRSLVFTPAVFVPVAVLAVVVLFVGYLYYQFTSFAVAPLLEVSSPATDAIAEEGSFVVRGKTVPNGRVTIQVFPGPMTLADIKPEADGTFSAPVALTLGANHIVVEVLDPAGKVSRVDRSVLLQPQVAGSAPPIKLTVDSPANAARIENAAVVISGSTDATNVTVNGFAVPITQPGGRWEARMITPAGEQTFTIVARGTDPNVNITQVRTVTVAYTAAVILVAVKGGDAWMQATVDGNVVAGTGRVYKDGETAAFQGREVRIRTGNAAVTQVTYNGQFQGVMGTQGQVVEKTYTAQ